MNKRILSFVLIITAFSVLEAAADELLFMPGLGCNTVLGNTGQIPVNDLTDLMVNASASPTSKYAANNQVIVTHSQGGLRALVYAEKMRQAGKGGKIKGIITNGSPVLGHLALSRGKVNLNTRIKKWADKITHSYTALLDIVDIFTDEITFNGVTHKISDIRTKEDIIKLAGLGDMGYVSGAMDFIYKGIDDINCGLPAAVIDEFVPENAMIEDYVQTGFHWDGGYWTSVQIGSVPYPVIVGWRWCVPIIEIRWQPVYVPYFVLPYTVEDKRLSANMRLAHIVGTDNDPLSLAASASDISYDEIDGYRDTVVNYLRLGQLAYAAEAVVLWTALPLTILSGNIGTVIEASSRAVDLGDTADFIAELPTKYGDEILLTRNNDGFVSSDTMALPETRTMSILSEWTDWDIPFTDINLTATGATWLNGSRSASIYTKALNHKSELDDPDIWGEGGSFDARKIVGGFMYRVLVKLGTTERTSSTKEFY